MEKFKESENKTSNNELQHECHEARSSRDDEVEDDGPKPMKHCKDSEKVRNSADKFSDHHKEYEARGKQSHDSIDRVHKHNTTYPRLYDELEKRRSINKITVIKPQHRNLNENICEVCRKIRKDIRDTELKRYNYNHGIKTRARSARVTRRKNRVRNIYRKTTSRNSRVTKPRQRRAIRIRPHDRFHTMTDKNISCRCRNMLYINGSDSDDEASNGKDNILHSNPDSGRSDVSIGSYNSNNSMDQEPMVSE